MIIEITSCDDHVMQSEEHITQLNEEKDCLASNIRQEVAHSNAMETEHVSDTLPYCYCYGNYSHYFKQSMINWLLISNY